MGGLVGGEEILEMNGIRPLDMTPSMLGPTMKGRPLRFKLRLSQASSVTAIREAATMDLKASPSSSSAEARQMSKESNASEKDPSDESIWLDLRRKARRLLESLSSIPRI